MQINQSFRVFDTITGEYYYFIRLGENNWIAAHKDGNPPMTQDEVDKSYLYFSSHWQDFDITDLQNKDI